MQYLIDPRLPQWKGNLHTHTTQSDGRLSPEEVVALYEKAGYDFLALTDHRRITDPSQLSTSMLLIPGLELDYIIHRRHRQAVHLIGVGVREGLMDTPGILDTPQQGIDAVLAQGGQIIFAHPAWSLNEPEVIEELRGISAVEIYNHVSDAPWNAQRGDSSSILDLCCCDGHCLPFVAGDDAHFYNGDQCFSALVVSAPERTREGILAALSQGRVYASQGPRIEEMKLEAGVVSLRFSPAEQVIFYSDAFYSKPRLLRAPGMTEAQYTLREEETYIRAEITDAQGRRAWTSPASIE